jgi:hypothetical protein
MATKITNELDTDALKTLCRDVSLSRLKSHALMDSIFIDEVKGDEKEDFIGQWLSLIFVSNTAVKISFKTHFKYSEAQEFAKSAFNISQENRVEEGRIEDFVKEFCNLTAGAIKQNLEKSGFSSLISLPLLTRPSDEVFFVSHPSSNDSNLIFNNSWLIKSEDGSQIMCSFLFEVYDPNVLKETLINAFTEEDEDDGDIDLF